MDTPPMIDADRKLCLRRLRFPEELEAAFRLDHYQRTVPALRIGLALMILTMIGQATGWYLQNRDLAALQTSVFLRPLPALATIALTFWPGAWRWWQWYFSAVFLVGAPPGLLFIGAIVTRGGFWSGPAAALGYLGVLTLYGMVMLSGVLRLLFGWTALIQVMLFGASLRAALTYVPLPATSILGLYGYVLLPSLGMVLFASYTSERLQRAAFLNNHLLALERRKSETILRNTLPDPIVDRLMANDALIADDHREVTVLFADLADFTPWAAGRPAREVLQFLNEVFSCFDRLVEKAGLEKIKTVGDCYMVVGGAPSAREDHPHAVACLALALRAEAERLSGELGMPIRFRIGVHTGPLAAGVIGQRRFLYDVWGDTVNIASRLESHGIPGTIQVSEEVAERLGARFVLTFRGLVEIKGKGPFRTYLLEREADTLPPSAGSPAGCG